MQAEEYLAAMQHQLLVAVSM